MFLVRRISVLILILALILISLSVGSIQATDISGSLFLAHFDDNTQNARDGNSGTSSGISYSSAKFGNGVTFDGTDQLYYGASGNINRSSGTVEFWYKPSFSFSSEGNMAVLFMYDDNSQNLDWLSYIGIWGEHAPGGKTHIVAEITVNSAGVQQTIEDNSSLNWNAGELHHIAITWDSGAFKLYSDGVLRGEVASPTLLDVDRDSIFIGNDLFGEATYSGRGTIDELLITNNARSASDISSDASASEAFSIATTTTTTDTGAPSISDVSVGSITKTTAAVSWTTNENSDSEVEYGTSISYGKTLAQEGDSVTSHTVTLIGLTPGTTHHYRVKSTDSTANQSVSSDYSFTTVDFDRVPPKVSFDPTEKVYATETPTISGVATDNQSGVASLSYTLDGTNFIPISGTGRFSIELKLEDANYRLQVKAIDREGNVALSSPVRFVVDTLPPSLAGASFFLGPQKLFPDDNGALSVVSGSKLSMTISAVGGPTMVQMKTNGETYSLTKIKGTNLWQGEIGFNNEGQFELEAFSKDGAANEVTQNLNPVSVSSKGTVTDSSDKLLDNAEVLLYVWIETSPLIKGEWQLWEAEGFGQQNPQKTDESGSFHYLLPQGKYQLVVKKTGFRDFVSEPFVINKPTPINPKIKLSSGWLPWFLDIFAKKQKIVLEEAVSEVEAEDLGIGNLAADFSLPSTLGGEISLSSLRGRRVLLSFWTTWDPVSIDQIAILDEIGETEGVAFLPIAIQESLERTISFLERGKYLTSSLVDETGRILKDYRLLTLPQHILIGEDGRIKAIKTGVLSKEELLEFIRVSI